MDEYKVVITEPAQRDLTEIAAYIANELQEPETAVNLIDSILSAIDQLQTMPARIALANDDHLSKRGVRRLMVKNHSAFFRIIEQKKCVEILHIRYFRRDWQDLL